MEFVQRIMGKLVGEEISIKELEEVSGALKSDCEEGFPSWYGGGHGDGGGYGCDYD